LECDLNVSVAKSEEDVEGTTHEKDNEALMGRHSVTNHSLAVGKLVQTHSWASLDQSRCWKPSAIEARTIEGLFDSQSGGPDKRPPSPKTLTPTAGRLTRAVSPIIILPTGWKFSTIQLASPETRRTGSRLHDQSKIKLFIRQAKAHTPLYPILRAQPSIPFVKIHPQSLAM
jgi:hypothetical protein